jgi:hypothetical protein
MKESQFNNGLSADIDKATLQILGVALLLWAIVRLFLIFP